MRTFIICAFAIVVKLYFAHYDKISVIHIKDPVIWFAMVMGLIFSIFMCVVQDIQEVFNKKI